MNVSGNSKKENEEISEQIAKREKREMSETNEIEAFPKGKDLIPFKKSLILAQDERCGVPNTCKSSEKLLTDASVEVKSGKRRTGE